jgi:hypothetical protein
MKPSLAGGVIAIVLLIVLVVGTGWPSRTTKACLV